MNRQEDERASTTNPRLSNDSANQPVETNSRSIVADLLVEAHPCCCELHAKRSVERFRYLGVRKHGMWFDTVLDSQPEELRPEDVHYILRTWEQWVASEDPFGMRKRRVST